MQDGGAVVFDEYIDIAEIADDPAALARLNAELDAALQGPGMKGVHDTPELALVLAAPVPPVVLRVRRETMPPAGTSVVAGQPKCGEGFATDASFPTS